MSIFTASPRYPSSDQAAPLAPGRGLSFRHRLPAGAVHKTSPTEVLLTDALRDDDGHFTVGALWHRDRFLHGFLHDGGNGRAPDPLLLAETVRQTLIHLSHRFHGVPQGHPFVLDRLDLDLTGGTVTVRPDRPARVVLDVVCTRRLTTPRRAGFALQAAISVEGVRIGLADVRWEVLHPNFYQLIRHRDIRAKEATAAGAALPPAAPVGGLQRLGQREVGYPEGRHVLLARDERGAPGQFWFDDDPEHPVLHDHPSDHIAGMALLEAFRQAGRALGAPLHPAAVRSVFTAFAEPDAPVAITVTPGPGWQAGPRTAEVTAAQHGIVLASARLAYRDPRQKSAARQEAS
ncbi:ScbA/BarX family gamma-butyrolactone biosynthesis protein [Kitasatospora sp. NPDC127059]|uniref:ScbA/BarX family gamma-butyrolactone biosynthesis protein n=1 Tax=unclassified Kitasatospora TaxID=2633591 RepID=UPI00364CB53E